MDAAAPERIAGWWAGLFGLGVQRDEEEGFCWLAEVPKMPWEMVFQPVPEAKQVKNHIH